MIYLNNVEINPESIQNGIKQSEINLIFFS